MGNSHNNIVPYQVFSCKDRPLMVACGNNRLFYKFCDVIGKPEWASDKKYRKNVDRLKNRDELTEGIQRIMHMKTADEWFSLLSTKGVPAGPVNNVKEVFEHPQVQAREMVQEVKHPTLGSVKLVRNPILFSNTPISVKKHPPLLGEHTNEILQDELGLSIKDIKRLKEVGAI